MKFKILCICLIIVVFLSTSICFSEQPNAKVWERFSDGWYYNKTNIIKSLSIWTYRIVTDKERQDMIEWVKKYKSDKSIKYQNYDHNVILWEIDCRNKQWKMK